jgi:hypothetical protein
MLVGASWVDLGGVGQNWTELAVIPNVRGLSRAVVVRVGILAISANKRQTRQDHCATL